MIENDLRLGVRQVHDHLALPLLPLVQDLGQAGLPFDATVRDRMVYDLAGSDGAGGRIGVLDRELAAHGLSNPSSNKVLERELLALGVPLSKRTASGNAFTVDLDVLGRIHHHYNVERKPKFPFLLALMERKRLEKARANLESLRPCLDGKLRTALRSTGTETGRYSSAGLRWCNRCKQPSHGTNLQNLGKNNKELGVNVKDCFVAPAGYVLWELDYSMLELRLMAYLANVEKLIARMEDPNGDVHTANTHALFDGRYSDTLRTLAKNFFYALQYGGSEGAIQIALAKKGEYLEQAYIQGLMLKIFTEYPEIALWQQGTAKFIERKRKADEPVVAYNAYGGCRVLLSNDPLKEFLSTVVQGTAAYTMSFALLRLTEEAREPLVIQVHDAFVGCSPEERALDDMRAVKAEMEKPIWVGNRFAVLPADGKISHPVDDIFGRKVHRWSDMQKVDLS